jgi:multidrug resistance efflux pump
MRDCYVDFTVADGEFLAGDVIFRLNAFELDRETFKLAVELQNARLSERRLSEAYIDRLVIRPLQAGVDFAGADLLAAENEWRLLKEQRDAGVISGVDLEIAATQVSERKSLLARSEADLTQRNIEIDGQRRRLLAEFKDLNERIILNSKIRGLHEFRLPSNGRVTMLAFEGGFVEEGDVICRASF